MGLLSRELTDATVVSIGHRPELAAFHQRKIVLERTRKGAELVDEAGARSRDLLRRFWNSAAGFWGQYGTPVAWFLSSGFTDAADEGGCHVQTRCNESAAHGRSWASDVKGALVYLIVGLLFVLASINVPA